MENQLELREEEKREKKWPKLKIGRRPIIITCAILLIATAVVLNIVLLAGKGKEPAAPSGGDVNEGGSTLVDSTDGYFSATQVSRQRARDEALEVLQSVVDSESADEATKTEALMEIADLAKAMEAEANIETLILAKGFDQCVAVINGETCSVVVSGGELQPNQISQINEIVYEQTGIKPANIRIVTK
ncbi:MAG: SpoIIIAH-like family protein [Ruminococcaceae bacterium]|nr:SpoIIIAH-like family protein [Oscillospiraceae bacterium]